MKLFHQLASALAVADFAGAYLVAPPGTAAPGTTSSCSGWVQMTYALTCEIIESYYGMIAAQFESWVSFASCTLLSVPSNLEHNLSVTELGSGCNLIESLYYCVQVNFISMSTGFLTSLKTPTTIYITSTAKSTTATTISKAGNGVSTPSPIQTGMASNFNKFYAVVSGDTCAAIVAAAGISLTNFYSWNPAVGSTLTNLKLRYHPTKIL